MQSPRHRRTPRAPIVGERRSLASGANHQYASDPLVDRALLDAVRKIADHFGIDGSSATIQLHVSDGIADEERGLDDIPEGSATALALTSDKYLVHKARLRLANQAYVFVTRNEAGFDVRIQFESIDVVSAARLLAVVQDLLPPSALAARLASVLGPPVSAHYAEREKALTRLEAISDNIISKLHANAEEQKAEWDKRRLDLETSYDERRARLEEEHSGRLAAASELESTLQQRAQQLDDRETRHARRDVYQKLLAKLQDRNKSFTLSPGTNRMRRPVFWTFIAIGLASACSAAYSGYELFLNSTALANANLTDTPSTVWVSYLNHERVEMLVRFFLSAAMFVATSFGFARWNHAWASRHADAEFWAKSLEVDIDRATWVVELAMEYKESTRLTLPSTLLAVLTRGIFEASHTSKPLQHPVPDALGAILSSAIEAEIDLPNGRAKLNRKGIRDLAEKGGGA